MKYYGELIGNLAGCGVVLIASIGVLALTVKGIILVLQLIF